MGPQGPPSGPAATPGPGGEIPPNTQQPMPMSGFNQGQNMGQGGYRGGPVMPGQVPAINRKFVWSGTVFIIFWLNVRSTGIQNGNFSRVLRIVLRPKVG